MSVTFYIPRTEAEMNVANASASKILIACGIRIDDDFCWCGEMTAEQARHGAKVLNGETNVFFQEAPIDTYVGFTGPRVISMGYDAERLTRYAKELDWLAEVASLNNSNIFFE